MKALELRWAKVKRVVLILMCVLPLQSKAIGLKWAPNTETNLLGYKLYVAQVPFARSNALQVINAGLTNRINMPPLIPGRAYYFQVTAFNEALESDPSSELVFVHPLIEYIPGKTQMRLMFTQVKRNLNLAYFLEVSQDLVSWSRDLEFTPIVTELLGGLERVEAVIEKHKPQEFYRVAIEIR